VSPIKDILKFASEVKLTMHVTKIFLNEPMIYELLLLEVSEEKSFAFSLKLI